jgi:potassium efflux system protein
MEGEVPHRESLDDLTRLRAETTERLKQIEGQRHEAAKSARTNGANAEPNRPAGAAGKVSRARSALPANLASDSTTKAAGGDTKAAAGDQELYAILAERRRRLEEHRLALKEWHELNQPERSPDKQLSAARADLDQLKTQLGQPPQNFLPPAFKTASGQLNDSVRGELKEAIETLDGELKEWRTKLEAARAQPASARSKQAGLRAERDDLFKQVAASTAKGQERESAIRSAKVDQARLLAQERLMNFRLEARIDALRLKVVEAKLARELKLQDVRELDQQRLQAHVQLSRKLLDLMQERYRQLAESRSRDLEQAAARQEIEAREADDPLARYRARRKADLLDLESKVVKNEQALATRTHPALEEERASADRAEADFAEIKLLLADGNVSRLDALRLNNDFRRIGPERDRLLRNELASIEAQLQFYENNLTNVELELIEGSLADQVEHEAVMERLPPERHGQARAEFASLEQRHKDLLMRQRAALTKLVARAAETLEQVNRRLHVLEDEYGFIRTNIFWVRDREPIGQASVSRTGHELRLLAKGLIKLVRETCSWRAWGQLSSEFLTAAVAAVVLPPGLFRLRRLLLRRITRALPPTHLHGGPAGLVRVDMPLARRKI